VPFFLKRLLPWLRDDAGAADRADRDPLAPFLGPLEIRVLESLWESDEERTVRGILDRFSDLAYTTVMTTLDRLFKKGLLERSLVDRAYRYRPRFPRRELERRLAAGTIESLLRGAPSRRAVRPILSTFVEAVSRRDRQLLLELEKIVRETRRKDRGRGRDGRGEA
jgi:predicted transcriptional regulator